jgi:hypothetical protein
LFDAILSIENASRATAVVEDLLALGFRGSLTGGLALAVHMHARGHRVRRRPLNDLDFVIDGFPSLRETVADRFLLTHVHPIAPEGKLVVQLIDPQRTLRVDVFRAFGATLSRSASVGETGPLGVVSLEDLVARTTAHLCGRLRAGHEVDAKYVQMFLDLANVSGELMLDEAWHDHREDNPPSFTEAFLDVRRLLARHPERVTTSTYSALVTRCNRCQNVGPFQCASPAQIVEILGYC